MWTDDAATAPIKNVGVDHGDFDVFVAEEFLDGADVVAVLEEVGGEGVAEGVAADAFGEVGGSDGLFECFLESAFVEMVALPDFGVGVLDAATRREDPLPNPLFVRVWIFAIEGEGHPCGSIAFIEVLLMEKFGAV